MLFCWLKMKSNSKKIYINISVDTENMNTPFFNNEYNQSILKYGTESIVNILKQFNMTATFFLSIFEHYKIEHRELQEVVNLIKEYEVGLHTHPLWIGHENMHTYDLNEQIKLIKEGISLFEKYGLERPKVHRAGAYGLNKNTIEALKKNKINIDSSMFYSHPNCKEVWSQNAIIKREGFIEFPVTIFRRNMYDQNRELMSDKIVKVDINRVFYDEFINFIDFARKNNHQYINLFMHSYSLLNFQKGEFARNSRDEKKLHKILEYISEQKDLEVVTLEFLAERENVLSSIDAIPVIDRVFDQNLSFEENY